MARWAAIIGPRGSGKNAPALAAEAELRSRGIRTAGFLQLAVVDDLGRKSYDLLRVSRGERLSLATPSTGQEVPGRTTFCSFSFLEQAFAEGRRWLTEDEGDADVVFIDEVSKLEAAGQGHYATIRQALALENRVVVLCIRADQAFYVVEKLALEDDPVAVLEVPVADGALAEFVDALAQIGTSRTSEICATPPV